VGRSDSSSLRRANAERPATSFPEGENNVWALVHLEDLGDLYARLLAGEVLGGTLLIATGNRPLLARKIAEAAGQAGGAGGKVEPRPLDEALEELGDYAYSLALNRRLSNEMAQRLLGWAPSATSVFEELECNSYS
jgi:nucleoside-diphosphate-sugar epimerase